jgi:hypothetical protein
MHLRGASGLVKLVELFRWAKAMLIAQHDLVADFRPATRSSEQNALFHALCGDIAASGIEWFGRTRTPDEWKVLLVSGHAIATGGRADMVPGLEGEPVNLRESTARMSVARKTSLIEYTLAFGAQKGVKFTAPEWRDAA